MKKIACLDAIAKCGLNRFSDDYQITPTIEEANGILVRSSSMHDMTFSKNLHCIARAGAGVNNIPLDVAASSGIVVFNTPGANANAVKELVIASLLLVSRDIIGGNQWVNDHQDDPEIAKTVEKAKKAFAGHEIAGKSIGVIGLGAIGTKVANACSTLGLKVYGYDPFISVNSAWSLSRKVIHITDINEILSNCDFITLHMPLTPETKGMINASTISKMKQGTILLNFSRDILVNENDLSVALEEGKVARYVTDFPNPTSVKMKNTICIPHLGASTAESEDNCAEMAVDQIMDYLENGNIRNSVNYPNCSMGVCSSASRIAILHQNIPNMIGQITQTLAASSINIANLINNSRNQVAYTLMDLENHTNDEIISKVEAIQGVFRVIVVK